MKFATNLIESMAIINIDVDIIFKFKFPLNNLSTVVPINKINAILQTIEIQFIKTVSPIHFFELSQIDSNLLLNIFYCLHFYRLHFCEYNNFS